MSHTKQRLTDEQRDLVEQNLKIAGWVNYSKTRLDRDDVFQEAALGVMTAAVQFRPELGPYDKYARRLAIYSVNGACEKAAMVWTPYKKRKLDMEAGVKGVLHDEDGWNTLVDRDAESTHDVVARAEWHERFYEAFRKLPNRDQEILQLSMDGMNLKQIAEVLGLHKSRLPVIYHRALGRLADIMVSPNDAAEILARKKPGPYKSAKTKAPRPIGGERRRQLAKLRKKAQSTENMRAISHA
jgi:RNA polymerase sigma factor (sigma-70 family)